MLAQARGDYEEAERRYRQSLTIKEGLGNAAGLATTLSQLGVLRVETGNVAEGIPYSLQALAIRLDRNSHLAAVDVNVLRVQRDSVGNDRFVEILHERLADEEVDVLLELLADDPEGEARGSV
jgi:hypothetical protein